ncbi:MAG: DUF2207 domain-containing protein [Anaerovoracaceae bacterium]|jgi:uncharacterized membrane protein YgcG
MRITVKKRILGILLCALTAAAMLFTLNCGAAKAAGYNDSSYNDYVTDKYDLDFNITKEHVVHVKETIEVNFLKQHHGIERYIPIGSDYRVKNVDVTGGAVDTSKSGRRLNIRIGDEDKLLTGKHTYTIKYDLVYRADPYEMSDYLSLDLFPTGWETSVPESDITVTMPKDVDRDSYKFYAGSYGGTAGLTADSYNISENGRRITVHLTYNPPYNGITLSASLPDGYWDAKPSPYMPVWVILMLAGIIVSIILLLRQGSRGETVETVEFYPPDGMTPAEAGYVIDGTTDKKDLTSMILYYASKGYLKIYEYQRKKYELIKLREISALDMEKPFSVTLFNGLFKDGWDGRDGFRHMRINDLDEGFLLSYETSMTQLDLYYKANEVYTKKSKTARYIVETIQFLLFVATAAVIYFVSGISDTVWALSVTLAVVTLLGTCLIVGAIDHRRSISKGRMITRLVFGSILLVLGTLVMCVYITREFPIYGISSAGFLPSYLFFSATAVTTVCAILMPRLTDAGRQQYGKVLGFRNFIRDAEYERMKMLSDQDPEYFYKIMPYAEVFGMSTKFAKKFVDIPLKNPGWYSSYDGATFTYSPLWYCTMMDSVGNAVGSHTASMPDSGDSGGGFSGGGFSGGGGGGGGGGAW